MNRNGFPARRITTTAEPCSSFDRTPAGGVWTVYREPVQYSAAVPVFVYRTPSKDTAQALAAELNATAAQGEGHYFYHRGEA